MAPVIIYITGFRQHAGKTVAALGIISCLKKVMDPARIGFFKPVGQEMVSLASGRSIDKDALIVDTFSGMPNINIEDTSPVRLTSGFTRKYLDSPDPEEETRKLRVEINRTLELMAAKDIIIAEASGHPGVGSIVGLSNAKVSNLMKAEIIFLSAGGIGRALDQLEVDIFYFLYKKSRVRGIIFNKLLPDKIPTIKRYITEDLLNRKLAAVGGPLRILGFLPLIEDLSNPSMNLISRKWENGESLGNPNTQAWKTPCKEIKVLSKPSENLRRRNFLNPGDLIIMSCASQQRSRSILKYNKKLKEHSRGLGGIILAGGNYVTLDSQIKKEIAAASLPALYVPEHMATCEQKLLKIYESTKLQVYDNNKIEEIEKLFLEHFDMQKFLDTFNIKT